jgi:hypothetical protein
VITLSLVVHFGLIPKSSVLYGYRQPASQAVALVNCVLREGQ